jgi:Domain of unknown function (DUF4232)
MGESMNELNESLRDLLDAAVGEPPRQVSVAAVRRRVKRRRAMECLAGATAAAVVAVAVPAGTGAFGHGSVPRAAAASPRPCADSAVTVVLGSTMGAATMKYMRWLGFVNRSGTACTLTGYPVIAFVTGPGGSRVDMAAGRGPGRVRRVVLAPGGRAWAMLMIMDTGAFGSACSPRRARGLLVYPPGQRTARYLSFAVTACAAPSPESVWVWPVGGAS